MSAISRRRWRRIQEIERAYHDQKDPRRALEIKRLYWQRVLAALPRERVGVDTARRILDVGCGGAGILLVLERGERTGLDPLMEYYLERFPFLKESGVHWVEGCAEDLEAEAEYELAFAINMLDHTRDPHLAARKMARALSPGGHLILILNVHTSRFWRAYFRRLYRFVDAPHPHHVLDSEVPTYFPRLKLVETVDIDPLWLDLRERYEQEALKRRTRRASRYFRAALNPFALPLFAAGWLGRPVHTLRPHDRAMIVTKLYLFEAEGASGREPLGAEAMDLKDSV